VKKGLYLPDPDLNSDIMVGMMTVLDVLQCVMVVVIIDLRHTETGTDMTIGADLVAEEHVATAGLAADLTLAAAEAPVPDLIGLSKVVHAVVRVVAVVVVVGVAARLRDENRTSPLLPQLAKRLALPRNVPLSAVVLKKFLASPAANGNPLIVNSVMRIENATWTEIVHHPAVYVKIPSRHNLLNHHHHHVTLDELMIRLIKVDTFEVR